MDETPEETLKVRPLNPPEITFSSVNKVGIMLTVYQITLKSKKPLSEDIMKTALTRLQRKIPSLSLCIRTIGEEKWFCNRKDLTLDFQVVTDTSSENVIKDMLDMRFKEDVLLWICRLLDLKTLLPDNTYQYELFFLINHGITDGFSTFTICRHFLSLLNEVIDGKEIDESSVATFTDSQSMMELLQRKQQEIQMNPEVFGEIKQAIDMIEDHEIIFKKHMPNPSPEIDETHFFTRNLNFDETQKLIRKFKAEKVSFHSGFIAICDNVLVEMVEDSVNLKIASFHVTNARRFLPGNDEALGCQIAPMQVLMDASNIKSDLWEYARNLHSKTHKALANQRPILEAICMMARGDMVEKGFENMKHRKRSAEYSTSNMGDLSVLFPGTGKYVEATWVGRYTTLHGVNHTFSHNWQTFRGQLLYTMAYTTKVLSDSFATQYVDGMFHKIRDLIKEC